MNSMFDSSEIQSAIIISGVIISYYMYYYFAHSKFLKNLILRKFRKSQEQVLFFTQKLTGFVFMGLVPGILYLLFVDSSFKKFGLSIEKLRANIPLILILVSIIIFILLINHRSHRNKNSLQVNEKEWNIFSFSFLVTGWVIYLIGYEFLFRGILLMECSQSFGFWPAIAVNIAIYSAIHMVNGKEQAIGSLVFGTIACYFTLTKGTLLIPIFMHISLSSFSDYFSIHFNKELRFNKYRKPIIS